MHEVWLSLKRITIQCKPHQKQVHDPEAISTHRASNIKGFIQRSKKHSEKHSPSFNGITHNINHEVVLDGSKSETKVCGCCCPCPQSNRSNKGFEGSHKTRRKTTTTASRVNHHIDYKEGTISSNRRNMLVQIDSDGPSALVCHRCGEKLKNLDAVEAHIISQHSVSELQEDSSRQIIETICERSSDNSKNTSSWQIECILKVQNTPKTLACFEEHREMVKTKAEKLQKKNHPRCLADGNEVLRFHGTTIACSLGTAISSCSLCTLEHCSLCQILRHGFSNKKEFKGALGVYTTSTSGKAIDSIRPSSIEGSFHRKSVIVCRVIAGIVFSPLGEIQEQGDSGFDSLAEKTSDHSDIEELCVLSPKAILPCFVVIYKQQTMKVRRLNSSLRRSF